MKKLMFLTVAALTAALVSAAPSTTGRKGTTTRMGGRGAASARAAKAADEDADRSASGQDARILIDKRPRVGKMALFAAPSVNGSTYVAGAWTRPRKWIVMETQYSVLGTEFVDQLTFTWHVLLDVKTSTLNRDNKDGIPQYSYFTTAVTYRNIAEGSHAASVVMAPSYLEHFGEPCAVGLEVTDSQGKSVAWGCESSVAFLAYEWGNPSNPGSDAMKQKLFFWKDREGVMDKKQNGKPMVGEHPNGLKDRSKTIWALVNPNDYEDIAE